MSFVEVVRGPVVESRHRVHAVVADAHGSVIAMTGERYLPTYFRSAAKPFQALPLVEEGVADRFGITPEEIAVCCASHEGEDRHLEAVRSILDKADVGEELLRCGPHPPLSASAARALAHSGRDPDPIHNNCSGKHAGMLALAVGMGWDPLDYHRRGHPVQRRVLDEMERWTGWSSSTLELGVDGCGVVCFASTLEVMAISFARLAAAAARGESAGRVVDAMTKHAFMVGGTGRACTDVMSVCKGRVFVKLGAEGVYGAGVPGLGYGVAIKIADGGRRAVEVALIRVLAEIGALDAEQERLLRPHGLPDVRNTRGEVVGQIRPAFTLDHRAAARG